MTLPQVLVIDDQYAWDMSLRRNFIENSSLSEGDRQEELPVPPLAAAHFCAGQRREENKLVNDYQVVKEIIKTESAENRELSLVLLDVRFDSGLISDSDGRPAGRPGDDTFGEDIRKRLANDFSNLPVVMLSSKKQHELHDYQTPYLSKTGLTPKKIASCLLRYGRLTIEQQRTLLHLPDTVVAESSILLSVFKEAFTCADNDLAVLILGETGTGKEVLARYIHSISSRADKPFVPINVAAIPDELVEAELFGHEKGAFTGADKKREGRFVQADGGTLFLDEIGDMPLSLQVKMLRVLQDGEVLPVGGLGYHKIDIRIIAATSRDLAGMLRTGSFREDLIRRISGFTLTIPPLRNRRGDILPLTKAFLDIYSKENDKMGLSLAEGTHAILERHPFVGNVGELQHIVQWLVSHKGNDSVISMNDIQEALEGSFVSSSSIEISLKEAVVDKDVKGGMDKLIQIIESYAVRLDDPLLQGSKPQIENAVRILLQRMAGAALERFRDPRKGLLNRQAAMQWLTGDDTLKGKGPGRVINEILGRKADTGIHEDDLQGLVDCWLKNQP